MAEPIRIRMGGYGPPTTTPSRALKMIGDRLEAQFGDGVDVKYVWHIMDFGYRADELLRLPDARLLPLSYQSTSYLPDRATHLGFADLPSPFPRQTPPPAAFDGRHGRP